MLRPSAHPSFASSSRNPPAQDCASGSLSEKAIRTPIWRGGSDCCARAPSGHATDELAIALMKSRRRIAFSKAQDHANSVALQQRFMTGEMGLGVSLHDSNLRSLMSALGHKRTFALFDNVRFTPNSGHRMSPLQTDAAFLLLQRVCGPNWQ